MILTFLDIKNLHTIFELVNLFNIKMRTIFSSLGSPIVQRFFKYGNQLSDGLHFSVISFAVIDNLYKT